MGVFIVRSVLLMFYLFGLGCSGGSPMLHFCLARVGNTRYPVQLLIEYNTFRLLLEEIYLASLHSYKTQLGFYRINGKKSCSKLSTLQ